MSDTTPATIDLTGDSSAPWGSPQDLDAALASFDRIVARIDGAVPDADAVIAMDLDLAA